MIISDDIPIPTVYRGVNLYGNHLISVCSERHVFLAVKPSTKYEKTNEQRFRVAVTAFIIIKMLQELL